MEPETVYHDELAQPNMSELGETNKDERQTNPRSENDQSRGLGRSELPEFKGKKDIDMIRCAIARHARFPIAQRVRDHAAEWLAEVAGSKEYDGRARVNAVKALADLDRLNMEEELRAQGGARVNIDVTTGGKPLLPDVRQLSADELEARIKALEGKG